MVGFALRLFFFPSQLSLVRVLIIRRRRSTTRSTVCPTRIRLQTRRRRTLPRRVDFLNDGDQHAADKDSRARCIIAWIACPCCCHHRTEPGSPHRRCADVAAQRSCARCVRLKLQQRDRLGRALHLMSRPPVLITAVRRSGTQSLDADDSLCKGASRLQARRDHCRPSRRLDRRGRPSRRRGRTRPPPLHAGCC